MRGLRAPCPLTAGSRFRRPHVVVCSTPASAWGASRQGSGSSKSYPSLSYSVNRRDISGAELALLLSASRAADLADPGQPLALHAYSYWCSQAGVRHATKLELALRRSVATVACFTTLDVYGEAEAEALRQQHQQQGEGGSSRSPSGSGSSNGAGGVRSGSPLGLGLGRNLVAGEEECPLTHEQHERERAARLGGGGGGGGAGEWPKPPVPRGTPDMEWNWLRPSSTSSGSSSGASSSSSSGGGGPFGRPAAASRKQLVGFARATGDNSLVATVYDVAVHPSMRGLGIGHRLVKLLLQQVQARAVYDIGVITPCSLGGFWERCSFEDDREDSTYMVFTGRSSTSSSSRNGGCSSSSSNGAGGHGASWADDVSDGSERAASGEGSGSLGLWSQQQPQQEQEVEDDAGLRRGSWEWREGTGSGEASDLAVAAAAAASRVQYGSQQWSDVSGGSSGGDSDGFDAGGHSNWGQQEPGQQRQQQQHEEAGWGVGGLEGPGGMLDECGCWTPHTTQALLERADLGHWAAAQQSESLRRLLDAKLQRLKEGGGRAGEPGAGTAAAARARGPRWTGLGGRSRGVPALPSPGNGVGLGGNSGNGSG